jgi:hypothetical protein
VAGARELQAFGSRGAIGIEVSEQYGLTEVENVGRNQTETQGMTPEELNAKTIDCPALTPYDVDLRTGERKPRHKRSEYTCAEVVCFDDSFAVGRTAGGKYVAVYDGHADLFGSLDELRAALNVAERELLPK